MFKILIVEDDKIISSKVKEELEKWGYEAYGCQNFNDVYGEFNRINPQLVLMDLMLPYKNGYYWCQEIRRQSNVPIIFISSQSENMNIVMAIEFGADDYITKPLDLSVMMAKIGAVMRRAYDFSNSVDFLMYGDIKLYTSNGKLEHAGQEEELTRTEMMIMETLFKAGGAVVSRNKIMERCWQGDDFIDDNTLAVNMTRLRKKLSKLGLEGLILTKKGVGYYLSEEVKNGNL